MNPQWSNQRQQQQQLAPQATGWQQQQPMQQSMLTGVPQMQNLQRSQMPGMQGMGQQPRPMQSMQTGMLGGGFGIQSQQTGFPGQPTLMPQATGYPGPISNGAMLGSFSTVPTTFVSTFMPSNPNANWSGGSNQRFTQGYQQAQPAPAPLPQFFQQHNQQAMGQSAVQVQWALTADERRNYDKIFRAWDQGSGFITGSRANEVFKESGLGRDDLMKIWALADRENRGKLNLAEFHVAMGLIYRNLSGNAIPEALPTELIPPSARDLDQSVDFLKDLLRSDTVTRAPNLDPGQEFTRNGTPSKYSKIRSFNAAASPEPSVPGKDATVYKHNDSDIKTYKSSSRHLDRRNVRFQGEDGNSELESMKRELDDSVDMLDRSRNVEEQKSDLKGDLDDLKYRIRRVIDDIEYSKSGRRTEAKEQELRRLERELLFLRHEKLPELEQNMREREQTKRSDDRKAARKRDSRNNSKRHAEESDRPYDRRKTSSDSDDDDEIDERDKGYMVGSYGRTKKELGTRMRFAENGSVNKEEVEDEDAAEEEEVESRKHTSRDPARDTKNPAPPQPTKNRRAPLEEMHPAPPPPFVSEITEPSSSSSKIPQTPQERQAFIRAEAQRRVQERMRVLTGQAPSTLSAASETLSTSLDSSVSERIEQDRKAAVERSFSEDKASSEREKLRQIKLEEEKLGHVQKEQKLLADQNTALRKVSDEITAAEMRNHNGGEAIITAAREELGAEEKGLYEREEALTEEKRNRVANITVLQNRMSPNKARPPPPVPSSRSGRAIPPKPPASRPSAASAAPSSSALSRDIVTNSATGADLPSPASAHSPTLPNSTESELSARPTSLPPQILSPGRKKPNTNPFRLGQGVSTPSVSSGTVGPNNPFFRPNTGALHAPKSVTPPIFETFKSSEEDWGDAQDKSGDESDSSNDVTVGESVQQKRAGLAGLLFGGGPVSSGGSRPGSTRPESPATGKSVKIPSAPLPLLGAAAGAPAPHSALLGAIQGGAQLRKAHTIDRSQALGAGSVIGDEPPPVQQQTVSLTPSHLSESPREGLANEVSSVRTADTPLQEPFSLNRQSVGWYGGLAADSYSGSPIPLTNGNALPTMDEELEDEATLPAINESRVDLPHDNRSDNDSKESPEAEFDMEATTRVRSLYAYEAQRDQDATFRENLLIVAHPPKNPASDWLFGIVPSTGVKGWLPKTYVEELREPLCPLRRVCVALNFYFVSAFNMPARTLYDYAGGGEEELSVQSGQDIFIGDKLDGGWARAIHNGRVGLVPLSYLDENL